MKLYLSEVIQAVKGELIRGNINNIISSISIDSRTLKKGDLFIPIIGKNYDGHDFIHDAIKKGASGFLFSKNISLDFLEERVFAIKVKDTLQALHDLASFYREKNNFKVIAITGSSGKTSTKYFTVNLFKDFFPLNFSRENYNNEIGVPLTILETQEDVKVLILELAMRGMGEIRILSRISKPDFALITNIGTAHIGILGSQENIARAKAEIFEYLKPEGYAVLNGDNSFCRKIYEGLDPKISKLLFGFSEENDVRGKVFYEEEKAKIFVSFPDGKKIDFSLPIYPLEIYQNLMGSLTLFWLNFQGFSEELIKEKIEDLSFPFQRLNLKRGKKGILLIDDTYNANPDSMKVAIDFLKTLKGKRKVAILGDMLELGSFSLEFHKEVLEYAIKSNIHLIFLYGEEMEKAFSIVKDKYKEVSLYCHNNFESLLELILKEIKEEDVVLVKGSRGMRMERFIKELEG